MHVEPIHPRRLVQQLLGDRERLRRTRRASCAASAATVVVEPLDGVDRGDQAVLERLRRASSRGLSSISSIARRRPTSRGSMNVELSAPVRPVFGIRPLEAGARRGEDEVAAHRDAESAGGGDAVDRGDERLRRAADLGDGAVDVLEDLLERARRSAAVGAGAARSDSRDRCASPPSRMNLRSAPLQNMPGSPRSTTARTSGRARNCRPARRKSCAVCDVERVEARGPIDRDGPDRAVPLGDVATVDPSCRHRA